MSNEVAFPRSFRRRRVLQLGAAGAAGSLLAAACGGQTPVAATAKTDDWDAVIAAAKKEGKVTIMGAPGDSYREAQTGAFMKLYPEISVEVTGFLGDKGPIWAKEVQAEQEVGKFNWDFHIGGDGPGSAFREMKARGNWLSLESVLRPEVIENAKWRSGWKSGWLDTDGKYWYSFQGDSGPSFYVNRRLVPESRLSKVDQLIDPEWKDKIAFHDPRLGGAGSGVFTHLLLVMGEAWATKFLQNVLVLADRRQLSESIVRDQYPIAGGLSSDFPLVFLKKGLGPDLKPFDTDATKGLYLRSGYGSIGMFAKAPHPNAAKVYVNWLLSKEGQQVWTNSTLLISRRLDITLPKDLDPLDTNKNYVLEDVEKNDAVQSKAFELAFKYVK